MFIPSLNIWITLLGNLSGAWAHPQRSSSGLFVWIYHHTYCRVIPSWRTLFYLHHTWLIYLLTCCGRTLLFQGDTRIVTKTFLMYTVYCKAWTFCVHFNFANFANGLICEIKMPTKFYYILDTTGSFQKSQKFSAVKMGDCGY